MKRSYINNFLTACVVALILIPAAFLKWIYPPGRDPLLFIGIGVVEAILALILLIYYRSWRIWLVLSLLVSIWMGFSLYTTLFGFPCPCMGSAYELPRGVTFALNGIMLIGAVNVLRKYPSQSMSFRRLALFFCFLFLVGFITSVFYYSYQT